jgi:hypothetical protein
MTREEILIEMVAIYKKYFNVVEQLDTLRMSPQDKQRLQELETQLNK